MKKGTVPTVVIRGSESEVLPTEYVHTDNVNMVGDVNGAINAVNMNSGNAVNSNHVEQGNQVITNTMVLKVVNVDKPNADKQSAQVQVDS